MKKEDIVRKLTSRKLWMAVALFISGLIVAFGGSEEAGQTVSGCIMQGAAVLGYLLAEGLADGKNAGSNPSQSADADSSPQGEPRVASLPEETV